LYSIIEEMGEQHANLAEYFCPSLKRLASICKAGVKRLPFSGQVLYKDFNLRSSNYDKKKEHLFT